MSGVSPRILSNASALVLGACVAREPAVPASAPTPAFGGERAEFGESAGEETVEQGVGACQRVPALSIDPLLDDFEQDSVFIRTTPERAGTWFLSNDGSPGGHSDPESYGVWRGGFAGSNHALHYKVDGYANWGAGAGFVVRYKSPDGVRCPFNATGFGGLAFVIRGSGRLRVRLSTPDTVPTDMEGGRCKASCWDTHGSLIYLTDDWTEHRIAWSKFGQQGWGTSARLNVAELLGVNFMIGREDQPAEMWLDDVRFVSAEEASQPPPRPVPVTPPPPSAPPAAQSESPSAAVGTKTDE